MRLLLRSRPRHLIVSLVRAEVTVTCITVPWRWRFLGMTTTRIMCVHTRLERAMQRDGSSSRATVTSAFGSVTGAQLEGAFGVVAVVHCTWMLQCKVRLV